MKQHLALSAALAFVSACVVTDEPDVTGATAAPIINGDECSRSDHPSAVALITDAYITNQFGDFPLRAVTCTGTLVAPDVVLTAAHCVDPSMLTFGLGEAEELDYYVSSEPDLDYVSDQTEGGGLPDLPDDARVAIDWVDHPGFDIGTMQGTPNGPERWDDIALVFLAEPIDDIDPTLIIDPSEVEQVTVDAEVAIAGWGQQTQTELFEPPPPGTVGIKVCGQTTINEVG